MRPMTLIASGTTRVSPQLAAEIGLNRSIVFLQIEFLLSITTLIQDDVPWVRMSAQSMQEKYFAYWSVRHVGRIIKDLADEGLLLISNRNRSAWDKTQWITIDYTAASELASVAIADTPEVTSIPQDTTANPSDTDTPSISPTCRIDRTLVANGDDTEGSSCRELLREFDKELPKDILSDEEPSDTPPEWETTEKNCPTPASRELFVQFRRKRWATPYQKEQFLACEKEVGPDVMLEAVRWGSVLGPKNPVKAIMTRAHNIAKKYEAAKPKPFVPDAADIAAYGKEAFDAVGEVSDLP